MQASTTLIDSDSNPNPNNNVKSSLGGQSVLPAVLPQNNHDAISPTTQASLQDQQNAISHVEEDQNNEDEDGNDDVDADDWLLSDEEIQVPNPTTSSDLSTGRQAVPPSQPVLPKVKSMADRDWNRVDAQFKDAGYREGITAGKLSNLQAGFDSGFNLVGAPLGSQLGRLRGEAQAMKFFLESHVKDPSRSHNQIGKNATSKISKPKMKKLNRNPMSKASTTEEVKAQDSVEENANAILELEIEDQDSTSLKTSNTPSTSPSVEKSRGTDSLKSDQVVDMSFPPTSSVLENPLQLLSALLSDLNRIALSDLAPPDYEALKHEKEHLEGRADDVGTREDVGETEEGEDGIVRETEEERLRREEILPSFQKRFEEIRRKFLV